jgi:demethylmenaquinone methyltransferase/2-methoxy-6-polyprenyl-1,4-benzoquinol methylase
MTYAESLEMAGRLTRSMAGQAIAEIAPPPGSAGADIGCGNGRHTVRLAETVGNGGKVIGLDISPENLAAAREQIKVNRLEERAEFIRGDLLKLPLKSGSLDWLWCADTLWTGFFTDDVVSMVREISRPVKRGGMVALFYWSNQTLLPGYPVLEARLNRAFAETTPYLAKVSPEQHFLKASQWLKAAGIREPRAKSFIADFHEPFNRDTTVGLTFCFDMFWGELEDHVSTEDWREFKRITDPESDNFILNDPGYHALITYTLFYGSVGD